MSIDVAAVESLIKLAKSNQLAELIVEDDDTKVVIKTALAFPAQSTVMAAPAGLAVPAAAVAQDDMMAAATATVESAEESSAAEPVSNYHGVTSPMVGTFYSSPSPDSPPFVEVGQRVSKGQTLCIIEAMKLMNELESDVSGVVKAIHSRNGEPVDMNQRLFDIDTN